jgi:hypothetical protein
MSNTFQILQIYLFYLIGFSVVIFSIIGKLGYKKILKLRWKILIIAILSLVPIIVYFGSENKWVSMKFSGQITQMRILEHEHANHEYTIVSDDNKFLRTIDPYGELDKFQIGDWVEKKPGEKIVKMRSHKGTDKLSPRSDNNPLEVERK